MGIFDTITGIKDSLFGEDVDTKTSSGPTSGTKTTLDSGQTTNANQNTKGSSTGTSDTINNSVTNNSGSTNVRQDGGRTDRQSQSAYTDTSKTGASSSTTTTSGRVDTSQVMLTETAVNHLINGMLGSTSGLAAVSSGQKAAGGYNSTATTLLTNDLLSRVAGEVAVRGAKTVNTIGSQSSTTNNSGSTTTNSYGAKEAFNQIGTNVVTDIIGGSTSSNTNTSANTTNNNTNQNTSGTQVSGPRNIREDATTAGSTSKVEKDDKGLLDWIICTCLKEQGKMPYRIYVIGAQKFATYDEQIKRGYYIWAVPTVKYMRKYPEGIVSKIMERIFNARAHYLAGNRYGGSNIVGFIATYSVHSLCWVLSRTIARNYNYNRASVYPQGA